MRLDKKSLEAAASTEYITQTFSVVSIKGWIALGFFIAFAAASILWTVFGTIPIIMSAPCVALSGESSQTLQILGFFPLHSGQRIQTGMSARIMLDTVDVQRYGMIKGIVTEVSSFPVSAASDAVQQIPSEALQAFLLQGDTPKILVVIEPLADAKAPSQLEWTSRQGPPTRIQPGATGETLVTLEKVRPISYIFPKRR